MNKNDFSEYGKEKTFNEILEELTVYCTLRKINPNIKLIVPKKILEEFSSTFSPKEKYKSEPELEADVSLIQAVNYSGGRIEIFATEDYDVLKKVSNE